MKYNKKLSDVNYFPNNLFSSVFYRTELDTYMECNKCQVSFYQNIIGFLKLIIKLGHLDIEFEVSALSIYLGFTRTGHIVQALNIFKYL